MKFEGIYTPVITPYREDYSIDYDRLAEIVDFLIEAGVHGIISAGTTGEYYAQTMQERFDLAKFIKQQIKGRTAFIVGTGAIRTEDSLEYARSAVEVGADALLVATPPYAIPTERENALHALAIDRVANLPIMLYNFPDRMGAHMGEEYLDRVGRSPNFCAIKESSGSPNRIHLLARDYPHIQLSCGMDDQALEFFCLGRAFLGLCRFQFRTGNTYRTVRGLRARGRFRQGPANHVSNDAIDGSAGAGRQVYSVRQAWYGRAWSAIRTASQTPATPK